MESSYWLRIDTGDRRGERVPVPASGLVVGRGEGADLVLTDPSVSSRHARLEVVAGGVRVRDLESKNGTRVGGERVAERLLAHGDAVRLGKVSLTFLDTAFAGGVEDLPTEDEGLLAIEPTELSTATRRRGVLGPVLALVALAAVAVLVVVRSRAGGDDEGAAAGALYEAPAGDLLGAGSFEAPSALQGWEQDAGDAFALARSARRSGAQGVGADIAAGRSARLASPAVRVREGQVLEARAHVRLAPADADARLSLAVSLEASAADRPAWVLAGEPLRAPATPGGFEPLVLRAPVLAGFDRARLVLRVEAGGDASVAVDDVSLAPTDAELAPPVEVDEFELRALGEPARRAVLAHIDRVLVHELLVSDGTGSAVPFALERDGDRVRIAFERPGRLRLRLSADLVAEGLAVRGADGYRTRLGGAEVPGATEVVAGAGPRLFALELRSPDGGGAALSTAPAEPGRVEVSAAPVSAVALRFAFLEERARVGELAARARAAERGSAAPGEALEAWDELLGAFPFDRELLAEASAARARLVESGLSAVDEIRRDFERARFFDLPDIYRRDRARAAALRTAWAGTEVLDDVVALLAEIDAALASSVDAEHELQVQRLKRVADILTREGASELAEHVRDRAEAPPEEDDER